MTDLLKSTRTINGTPVTVTGQSAHGELDGRAGPGGGSLPMCWWPDGAFCKPPRGSGGLDLAPHWLPMGIYCGDDISGFRTCIKCAHQDLRLCACDDQERGIEWPGYRITICKVGYMVTRVLDTGVYEVAATGDMPLRWRELDGPEPAATPATSDRCDCGAVKARTTHSTWCSTQA